MKSNQFVLLVVLAAGLGGGGLYVLQHQREGIQKETQKLGGQLLPNFDVNSVAGLRFTQGTNAVNIQKVGDIWAVKERGGYPANFGEIAEFVRKLSDLKIANPITVGASRLPMLELTKEAGTLVELLDKDGKTIKSVMLGKKHSRGSGDDSPFGGGGMPDGRYVQVGSGTEGVALVADALANANPKPEDWIAKDFLKVEQPIFIQVTHPDSTNSFTLSRTNEFGDWQLAEAQAGQELDKSKLFSFNTILSGAGFNDVTDQPDPAKYGLVHPVEAQIRTSTGFTYKLKLGKMEGDNYALQVATDGTFVRERAAAKDEKAEDKDKLDKEFKEKLSKQDEKLKTEQALAKWTYTVSKWSVDALLKTKSELLAEKKSTATPAPSPAPPGGDSLLDGSLAKPPGQ